MPCNSETTLRNSVIIKENTYFIIYCIRKRCILISKRLSYLSIDESNTMLTTPMVLKLQTIQRRSTHIISRSCINWYMSSITNIRNTSILGFIILTPLYTKAPITSVWSKTGYSTSNQPTEINSSYCPFPNSQSLYQCR